MSSKTEKLQEALRQCLREFNNDLEPWKGDAFFREERLSIPEHLSPPAYMVFITFVGQLGFKYWGREEKVSWSIPISYRGTPLLLSHRKFGLAFLCLPELRPTSQQIEQMLVQLNKAIRIVDALVKPELEQLFRNGHITIVNAYVKLSNMYHFFRKKAEQSFRRKPTNGRASKRDKRARPTGMVFEPWKFKFEGFYYSVGMIDAYFSRLEHLLIFVLPFIGFDGRKDSLSDLIGSKWGEKFKRVFRLASEGNARSHYEKLLEVKEKFRNPIGHGFFQKDNGSLLIHMPVVGAIPLYLSQAECDPTFSLIPISAEKNFREMCAIFDSFDEFLRTSSVRYGLQFAEAGLDVAFDPKSIAEYTSATASEESFDKFMRYKGYQFDQFANMDW